jgi:hypothetical protein
MGLVRLQLLGGAAALMFSFVMSVVALILGWRWKRIWILAVLLILMGFVPLVATLAAESWITRLHHLIMES